MTMPSEPSKLSAVPRTDSAPQAIDKPKGPGGPSESPPEPFKPPAPPDLASLTDGRKIGEFVSAYPCSAWVQIVTELSYLVLILAVSIALLGLLAKHEVLQEKDGFMASVVGPYPSSGPLAIWVAVALSGACGGCSASLKWLYHSVAKMRWHRDRIIWRIVVPMLSAVLALFSGMMIVSGLVPFLSKTPLTTPLTGAAFGFFVGFFSDNVLAGLQKLAYKVFGTVDTTGSQAATRDIEGKH